MLNICAPTPEQVAVAGLRFGDLVPTSLAPINNDSAQALNHLVEIGHLRTMVIRDGETPIWFLWYSLTDDGGFVGEAVVRMDDNRNEGRNSWGPQYYMQAAEACAMRLGCRWLRFKSIIRGAVDLGIRQGFTPESVVMFKQL